MYYDQKFVCYSSTSTLPWRVCTRRSLWNVYPESTSLTTMTDRVLARWRNSSVSRVTLRSNDKALTIIRCTCACPKGLIIPEMLWLYGVPAKYFFFKTTCRFLNNKILYCAILVQDVKQVCIHSG